MSEVTQILDRIEHGDPHAAEKLLPLVYEQLRKLAAQRLRREKPGQTLQATALVHEAYLRLVDDDPARHWNSRGHFYTAAAEAMRRILIERARRKRRTRHGGGRQRLALDELALAGDDNGADVLALDEALGRLAERAAVKAEVVKLRYFAGLSVEETGECLGISAATVKRHWTVARAWLFASLSESSADGER